MRPKVLEISWHDTQPVYSVDFQPLPANVLRRLLPQSNAVPEQELETTPGPGPSTPAAGTGMAREQSKDRANVTRQYRLATCGGDSKVRLWLIHPNIPPPLPAAALTLAPGLLEPAPTHPPRAEYLATLSKHTAPVNVVRFSPSGQTLASAGDDGNIILWVKSEGPSTTFGETTEEIDKEYWRLQRMIQVTTKEVYDLAWSPDGEWILAGSTDNTATIWRASSGECVFALREHAHNVQGVAWDPLNEYIATQSSDRSVHVNSFAFRGGMPEVHPISRTSRMEIRHSRTPSLPTSVRPNLTRRGSTQSDAGSTITSASEMTEQPSYPTAAPLTPSTSVPSTPVTASGSMSNNASMNPPTSNKPGSRRSSFSGSQAAGSPSLGPSSFSGRLGRSPSPIPPLPAIRAPPPSNASTSQRMYGDEGSTNFFRRLSFAPDGSLLLTPAGQIEDQVYKGSPVASSRSLPPPEGDSPAASSSSVPRPRTQGSETGKPTVYIYSRANLARPPIAHLPGHKTSAVAVKFSPIFYELRPGVVVGGAQPEPKRVTLDRNDPTPINVSLEMPPPPPPASTSDKDKEAKQPTGSVFALPYRLLFAVACLDSVLLYDTQQSGPIAVFKGLHYAGFTDVAWSPDGCSLMLSSSDGYCSIVVFDPAELGTLHPTQQHHRQLQNIAEAHSHSHTSHSLPPLFPSSSSNLSQSPALARASPAPPRSERESSTSSSIATPVRPPAGSVRPPPSGTTSVKAPSSVSGATDPAMPTPSDERDDFALRAPSSSAEPSVKRSTEESDGSDAAPKKKRRVNLTHLGGLDQ